MAFRDWLTDPTKKGVPLLKDWLASWNPEVWRERQYREYNEDPFTQSLQTQNDLLARTLEQFKQGRLEEAGEAALEARKGIDQWANLSGFTGTSTATGAVSDALKGIYSQANRDINQLGAQTEWQTQQNINAARQFEQGLQDARTAQWGGLVTDILGLGANLVVPGLGSLFQGLTNRYAGTTNPYSEAESYLMNQDIPWHLIFPEMFEDSTSGYSGATPDVGVMPPIGGVY